MLLFLALVPGLLAGMTDAMNRAPTQTQKAEPGPRPEIAGVTKKKERRRRNLCLLSNPRRQTSLLSFLYSAVVQATASLLRRSQRKRDITPLFSSHSSLRLCVSNESSSGREVLHASLTKGEPGPRPEIAGVTERKERRRRTSVFSQTLEGRLRCFHSYTVRWLKPPLPFCAGLSAKGI
jgi:hypothetical protein